MRRGARVSDRQSWTIFFWVNAALGASILLFWGAEGEAKLLEGVNDEGDVGWNEELCNGWRDNSFPMAFCIVVSYVHHLTRMLILDDQRVSLQSPRLQAMS